MSKRASKSAREIVASRSEYRCEYCLLSENVSFFKFHIEHIKSLKHGGTSNIDNLAYGCPDCNFAKGSDIATFGTDDDTIIRFFNPRKDVWSDHFTLNGGAIYGKTPIGEATMKIFKFNETERLIFRQQLAALNLYP
jgi:hypothetical protein